MINGVTVDYSHNPDEEPAVFQKAVGAALRKAAVYWRMNFTRKHFTREGAQEYGYRWRMKYAKTDKLPQERYRKAFYARMQRLNASGRILPLVWTGTLRTMVLGQFPTPRLKRNSGLVECNLSLRVPKYAYYSKSKGGGDIMRMSDELLTTSSREAGILENEIGNAIDTELVSVPGERKRKEIK